MNSSAGQTNNVIVVIERSAGGIVDERIVGVGQRERVGRHVARIHRELYRDIALQVGYGGRRNVRTATDHGRAVRPRVASLKQQHQRAQNT